MWSLLPLSAVLCPDAMSHDASKETEAEVVCLRSHSRLVVMESKSRSYDIAQLVRLSL